MKDNKLFLSEKKMLNYGAWTKEHTNSNGIHNSAF